MDVTGAGWLGEAFGNERMTTNVKALLAAAALWVFAGCRAQDPLIALAKSDFARQRPGVRIVESGIRSRTAGRVVIYVHFVDAPPTPLPSKPDIWERVLVYESKEGKWQCVGSAGDSYVRPVRQLRL